MNELYVKKLNLLKYALVLLKDTALTVNEVYAFSDPVKPKSYLKQSWKCEMNNQEGLSNCWWISNLCVHLISDH